MKNRIVLTILTSLFASSSGFASELLHGKTASGAPCSVRLSLDTDLVSFAGEGVAFGFFMTDKTLSETIKNNEKSVTVTGNDGPVHARLTLNLTESGTIDSASYSQRSFIVSKKVKCSDLK